MHVAYVTLDPMPKIGGEWTVLSQAMKGLRGSGHKVTLVSPSEMPRLWLTLASRFSQVVRIVFRDWLWFFVQMAVMVSLTRHLVSRLRLWDSADIIDAQGPMAFLAVYQTARRRNRPVVLTVHGYFQHESNMGSIRPGSFWGVFLQRIESWAYRRASVIVTVDSRLKDYVIRFGARPDNVHVRHNFVDCNSFAPREPSVRSEERFRLGLAEKTSAICCARRLEEKCGVGYAIEATARLATLGVDTVLLIAGTGSLEPTLRAASARLGVKDKIRFLGYVERADMPRLLAAVDAAVVPSVTVGEEVEATSLSALEAMACEIPVVASDIGGLKEIITNGVDGILVPERDAESLARGLLMAFGPAGKGLGKEARRKVEAEFSLGSGLGVILTLYRSLTAGESLAGRSSSVASQ